MKRIFCALFISLLCFTVSKAQLRVAILGGANSSEVLEQNNIPNWETQKNLYSPRTGVHLGFSADLPFKEKSRFTFQPGVIYYNKGRNYEYSQDSTVVIKRVPSLGDSTINTTYVVTRKQYLNYVDIPLNLVYKQPLGKKVKFIIGGGPYLSFFFNGSDTKDKNVVGVSYEQEVSDNLPVGKGPGQYATLDFGVNALAGFEFGRVFLTANYSRGFKDFYQPTDYTASEYKHQVMGVTLGIFLGKPVYKDADGDGVPDKDDKCPQASGLSQFKGCPDSDGDGIPDTEDSCPLEKGPADNHGCPYRDKDGDGLLDKDDKCPDVAGPKENFGCPYEDTDKDGILDKDDKCPNEAGVARYNGCPVPDTDGDGVNDEEDKCPTEKGTKENNGCPEIKEEIIQKVDYVAQRIEFKINSATLLPGSYKVLDELVTLLNSNPTLKVAINGHTSSDGTKEVNLRLSKSRAESVKTYLESKGVDTSRLTATGFGSEKPLNEGKTPEDRAKNRRVELEVSN